MTTFDKTSINRVRRILNRGHYDANTINPIIDEALICHVGPPNDEDADYALNVWAGLIPIHQHMSQPIDDPGRTHDVAVPGYVDANWRRIAPL